MVRAGFIRDAIEDVERDRRGEPPWPLEPLDFRMDARAADANTVAARSALDVVRRAMCDRRWTLKSANKRRSTDDASERTRFRAINDVVKGMNTLAPPAGASRAQQSAWVWSMPYANCTALSLCAQDHVRKHHPRLPNFLVNIGGCHSILVVGTPLGRLWDLDLASWPPHLQVCDPWANLTCPASDFPVRFTEKMAKWQRDGKLLLGDDGSPEWLSPLGPGLAPMLARPPFAIRLRDGPLACERPRDLPY